MPVATNTVGDRANRSAPNRRSAARLGDSKRAIDAVRLEAASQRQIEQAGKRRPAGLDLDPFSIVCEE